MICNLLRPLSVVTPSFIISDGMDGFAPSCPSWQELGRHYRPRPLDGTVDHTDCTFQSVVPATLARTLARMFAHECRVSSAL
jgi:hypothetical protein